MKRALVLSLICVLGLGFSSLAASLTGYWDTEVTIDPQQADFSAAISLTSELGVTYTVGDWAFTSTTNLTEAGWVGQSFDVAGVLGAFSISSGLVFDPDVPSFTSWNVSTGVAIAGVSFGADFLLADNDVELTLTGSGVAGDVSVSVAVTFGGVTVDANGNPIPGSDNGICDLDWSGVVVNIGFPFCCADIAAELAFNCSGFDYIEFAVTDIAVPLLPYLTIDATLTFTMDEKSLLLEPNLDFGDFACFELDIDFATTGGDMAPLVIGDISISGIGLTCDIGAVTFTGYSTFDGENLIKDTYWEYYMIETNDDACCGPFSFDLAFYFLQGGAKLFDVALIEANMELQIAAQFTFNMGLDINVESGAFTQWTVGFYVTW